MRRLLGTGTLALLLGLAAPAHGAVFFASAGTNNAAGCPRENPCGIVQAVNQAKAAPGRNTVMALAGNIPLAAPLDLSDPDGVDLVGSGAGPGATFLENANAGQSAVLLGATGSLSELRVKATPGNDMGVVSGQLGTVVRDARVETTTLFADGIVMQGGSGNPVVERASIAVPTSGSSDAARIVNAPASTALVQDVSAVALNGLRFTNGTAVVRRTTLDEGGQGVLSMTGGTLRASSTVVRSGNNSAFAVHVKDSTADLRNLTVVGFNAAGEGVKAEDTGSPGPGAVTLRGSIVRGFTTDLQTIGTAAAIDVGTSLYATKAGAVNEAAGGNLVGADPRFVDDAAKDFRLRFDSTAVDAGGTPALAPEESPTDRAGNPRAFDGNGSASAERDLGAFERIGPVASIVATPVTPAQGQAVLFDAGASSYADGALASFAWDLDGDGTFETTTPGPSVSRSYTAVGPVRVVVRAVGADGVAASAATQITVRDGIRPVVSNAAMDPVFAVSARRTAINAGRRRRPVRRGTTIRYRLSEAATVRIAIERRTLGRRVGRRCRPATRALRRRPRCVRWLRRGTLTRRNRPAGANRTPFSGRIGRRPLPAASYRARITATDAAGNASRPRTLRFRVLRR